MKSPCLRQHTQQLSGHPTTLYSTLYWTSLYYSNIKFKMCDMKRFLCITNPKTTIVMFSIKYYYGKSISEEFFQFLMKYSLEELFKVEINGVSLNFFNCLTETISHVVDNFLL